MKEIRIISSAIVVLSIIWTACKNDLSFKKTKGGMPYQLFENKEGKKVYSGGFVKVHLIRKINDSITFDSYGKPPVYFQVDSVGAPYDPSEVIHTLKTGDSVVTVQLIDTFMKRAPGQVPPQFKKGDRLITIIKVIEAFPNMQGYSEDFRKEQIKWLDNEVKEIQDYLAKRNIKAEKTGKGTFVQIINPGEGPLIDSGKYVLLNYTGTTFSGKTFDSNEIDSFGHKQPLGFVVKSTNMIQGFHEGISLLRKGSKAVFYIPSLLAYGSNSGSPDIKPYEHLIYELEVLDVQDKAPETKQAKK